MPTRLTHTQLLRYAGLITWVMVGSGLVMNALFLLESRPEGLRFAVFAMPVAAYLVFGLAFWLATASLVRARGRIGAILLLLAMTVSALAVSLLTDSGLGAILMMVMAAVVPWLLPGWPGVAWLVLQHLPLIGIFMQGLEFRLVEALMQSLLYAGVSGFVYVAGLVAKQQAEAREEQRRLNAELRATRSLLADSARVGERLRISRELHDLLGHHLTALSLNLEVAGHLSEGRAQEHVRQAHTLARLLLTDVREAVSAMRGEDRLDLAAALQTLVEGVPALEVIVEIEAALPVQDAEHAQVLLRCAQEIITNTIRHAQAQRLWLKLARIDGALRLSARDDGIGGETVRAGNGLSGMRERLQAVGGRLEIATAPGQGFRIDILLPLETPA
ncbi:sensor histidine kinase [Silanimonas sp.]|uniref:sensor histidine kinase n=1 Tax=Silanimonas sp. TaxID=1929290 RepID=UPI001BB9CC75|nr:sensor histidine kinase [Silanimonas sp.]MBS3895710.1 sensor histidine kinase [Silanimonas sp.]MBS3924371.1 sensor histidine kinase [Xanthomonadaceae bacterium]